MLSRRGFFGMLIAGGAALVGLVLPKRKPEVPWRSVRAHWQAPDNAAARILATKETTGERLSFHGIPIVWVRRLDHDPTCYVFKYPDGRAYLCNGYTPAEWIGSPEEMRAFTRRMRRDVAEQGRPSEILIGQRRRRECLRIVQEQNHRLANSLDTGAHNASNG